MLRKQGHEVVAVADSGQALVEQCAETQPDVIITDNLMPDLGGADAAAIIYAQRPLPIILLSGYCDRNLVLEAERKHVLIYLVKPISDGQFAGGPGAVSRLCPASLAADEAGGRPRLAIAVRGYTWPQSAHCSLSAGVRPLQYTNRGS